MTKENEKKHTYKDSLRELVPYVFFILTIVLIRTFIASPIKVNGTSMENTLHDKDTMILNKISMKVNDINRFQIVVIKTSNSYLIKRVIGLPGETIKYEVNDDKSSLFINGKKVEEKFLTSQTKQNTCKNNADICNKAVKIPNNYYYVMGYNRGNSIDSRIIGTINKKDIIGTTKLIIFPINDIGIVK